MVDGLTLLLSESGVDAICLLEHVVLVREWWNGEREVRLPSEALNGKITHRDYVHADEHFIRAQISVGHRQAFHFHGIVREKQGHQVRVADRCATEADYLSLTCRDEVELFHHFDAHYGVRGTRVPDGARYWYPDT